MNNNGAAGGSTAVQINSGAVPSGDGHSLGGAGVPGNNVQAGTTVSTQINGDKNAIGDGSVAQDGKFNVNMASATTSPIQVRDTSADDSAVAMDEGFAQNADDGGTNVLVTDPSLALAGRDATSGDNSPLTDNSTSANALGAAANDHSIATSADADGGSNAQNGLSNANGGSTAQTGLQNANGGSTAQNGEINNNGSGTASDQEANGGGGVNQGGSGVNVNVPNAQVALAGQDARQAANNTQTNNSTNANLNDGNGNAISGGVTANGVQQQGTTNVYVPDAAIAGHDAVTGGSTLTDNSSNAQALGTAIDNAGATTSPIQVRDSG